MVAVLALDFLSLVVSQHGGIFQEITFGTSRRQLNAAVPTERLNKRVLDIVLHHNLKLKYIEGIYSLPHYLRLS